MVLGGRAFGCVVTGLVLMGGTAAAANIGLVTLRTDKGETVRAILGRPEAGGRRPAIVFNHGTDVRRDGYEAARAGSGMNIDAFVEARCFGGRSKVGGRRPGSLPATRREGGTSDAGGRGVRLTHP